jgi:hypothetical protein
MFDIGLPLSASASAYCLLALNSEYQTGRPLTLTLRPELGPDSTSDQNRPHFGSRACQATSLRLVTPHKQTIRHQYEIVSNTYPTNYTNMEHELYGRSNMARVEDWVLDKNNGVDIPTGKRSVLRNMMSNNDVLVVVRPDCLTARVATRTERGMYTFMDLIKTVDDKAMAGLVVALYCAVGSDERIIPESKLAQPARKFIYEFQASGSCMIINEILDEVTYLSSDIEKDELMFLYLKELLDLSRTMQRVPFKFKGWSIIMPQVDESGRDYRSGRHLNWSSVALNTTVRSACEETRQRWPSVAGGLSLHEGHR